MPGRVRIGISGWTYAPWRGVFYPPGLPHRAELGYAAQRLDSIEVNGTFYALQRPDSFRRWYAETPADFVLAVKGPRFVTHMLRLVGVRTALANFAASGLLALGPKLGPVLWQLPATLAFDEPVLRAFLELLPRTTDELAALAAGHDARLEGRALVETDVHRPVRHALEVRHPDFVTPRAVALARELDVSLVVADSAGRWPRVEEVTADPVYVRLHGDTELYSSGYSPAALEDWAVRIGRWRDEGHDVVVYFDNDVKVRAPFDAMALRERLAGSR